MMGLNKTRAARLFAGVLVLGVCALAAPSAYAADEEIQVYMDEIGPTGKIGLDVHINDAIDGSRTRSYPGEQISDNRIRITPEFSYALNSMFELGAYLPLATIDRDGDARISGVKLRLKFIGPHEADEGLFWGANFELGRVNKSLDINPWNAELKGIIGTRSGPWTLATNFNVGWAVSGPATRAATFEIATKASYAVNPQLSVGLESYNDFGPIRDFTALSDGDQRIFGVVDTAIGDWDFNLGVGYGYGQPEDRWILKMIVGVPLGR